VQVSLAALSAAKTEIADRSKAQHAILQINVAAIGTVVGFVLATTADRQVLLLLPLLSSALGMLYLDHGVNISNLGRFSDAVVRKKLNEVAPVADVMGYEVWVRDFEARLVLRFLLLGVPVFVLFAGVPAGSLIFLWICGTLSRGGWPATLWSADLVLVLVYLYFWLVFMLRRFTSQLRPVR